MFPSDVEAAVLGSTLRTVLDKTKTAFFSLITQVSTISVLAFSPLAKQVIQVSFLFVQVIFNSRGI